MPQNIVYDETTGKYYDAEGNELTIADGAPVAVAGNTEQLGAPPPAAPDAAPPPAAPATGETPTTVIEPGGQPAPAGEAASPASAESSSSDGQLLDVEGVPQLARVRFTEREATDTEPAEYREETGNVVVGGDGALRFSKLEPEEGGQQ